MTHRGDCPRCGTHFKGVVQFSEHFLGCTEPVREDLLLRIFDVPVGEPEDCWEMRHPSSNKRKPPKIGVGRGDTVRVHVAMAIAVHGDRRGDGFMVCHSCDNVKCLNPAHMYWGTAKTNAEDAWRNGRRVMTPEQQAAMISGLRASDKHKQRMIEHNRELASRNSGDNHWTRRDPEAMQRWKDAMRRGREMKRGDADE